MQTAQGIARASSLWEIFESTSNGPDISFWESENLSRKELVRRARAVASVLASNGVGRGDRVVLMASTSPALVATIFAVWALGAITVPLPHFADLRRPELAMRRLETLLEAAKPRAIVASAEVRAFLDLVPSASGAALLSIDELHRGAPELAPTPAGLDEAAHIQFSSGSTGIPRGAVLTHRNILANVCAIGEASQITSEDRYVSWVPLFHDMGFIGGLLLPTAWAIPLQLQPTEAFRARPVSWLKAMSSFGGTLTPAPSSAYSMVARHVARLGDLDLSRWDYGWMGAEPVFERTIARFEEATALFGLRPHTVRPCYGLAEATLAVTLPPRGAPRRVIWTDSTTLRNERRIAPRASDDPGAISLVGVGRCVADTTLRIVSRDGKSCPEGSEGLIEIRGPGVTRRFVGASREGAEPEANSTGWLNTGDLGLVVDGELFVTGRAKDVIIRGGINIHPHEIEAAAETLSDVRVGRAIAFSYQDHTADREAIVLCVEPKIEVVDKTLDRAIRLAVSDLSGVSVDRVIFLPPGGVPKTSSGKLQRSLCKEMFVSGTLDGSEA